MEVKISKNAVKSLKKAPIQAQRKYRSWLKDLAELGLTKTRKIPGYHDEPLAGKKKGRRSIRLNKKWRLEYTLEKDIFGNWIMILEVHPHDY